MKVNYKSKIMINNREISLHSPTYFIADIASNHDGDIERAKELIWLAKEAGADAAKFQHFKAEKIVSDYGFRSLGSKMSHQVSWDKSVFDIYKYYECNRDWNEQLIKTAKQLNIDFMTTPYDVEAVELINPYLPAYKIGSGDITWTSFIEYVAQKEKPVLLATGAANMNDVDRAINSILKHNPEIVLMQCNTNYTGSLENFRYVNLNVLKTYALYYPNMILGLSDHTEGNATVLGAIALGARVVEKHFTDNNERKGPDHLFSMNPKTWREMIERSRELEFALGDGIKRIEENEKDTVIVQQRSLCLKKDMRAGEVIQLNDIECLRPAPVGCYKPYQIDEVIGKKLTKNKKMGDMLLVNEVEEG